MDIHPCFLKSKDCGVGNQSVLLCYKILLAESEMSWNLKKKVKTLLVLSVIDMDRFKI